MGEHTYIETTENILKLIAILDWKFRKEFGLSIATFLIFLPLPRDMIKQFKKWLDGIYNANRIEKEVK